MTYNIRSHKLNTIEDCKGQSFVIDIYETLKLVFRTVESAIEKK